MKNLRLLPFTLFVILFFTSCSSEDDGDNNNNELIAGNYFPSVIGNQWIYDVENINSEDSNLNYNENDFIQVDTETGNSYTLLANNNLSPAYGTMNSILVNGTLTRTDDMLKINSSIDIPIDGFENFDIDFNNVTLYDLNASSNEEMSNDTGSVSNPYAGGTLTVNYVLTTTNIGNTNSMTVNGETFPNITRSNMNVEISILLSVTGVQDLTILSSQDVISIDNYFAEDFGLIKSETDIMYEIDVITLAALDLLGITIDFPTSLTVQNVQELDSYLLSE